MDCKVIKCNCPNEGQDKLYGKGMRLHNPGGKPNTKELGKVFICTVCKNKK